VYGGLDGIITTFAIVSGVAGAKLQIGTVLIMGFANLAADAISMGMGDYLSSKAEIDSHAAERQREDREIEHCMEEEKEEMIELYSKRGLPRQEASDMVAIMSKHREFFVNMMMIEELGIMPPDPSDKPALKGLVTLISFILFGCVPLTAYVGAVIQKGPKGMASADLIFGIACALAALTMFSLGAITSKFTIQKWWKAGLSMLLNGILAAGAAFGIGFALESLG